jgi:arsenate reductase (thioredoxin)
MLRLMTSGPLRVLVLCTGNSCRSVLAEALINGLARGRYRAWSAGSHPAGYVHPKSIETLTRHGIDPGQPRSKSWNECAGQSFDLVITVCDEAAGEHCPLFPGTPKMLHWSTPDPAKVTGSEAEIDAAFDEAFFSLRERIEELTLRSDAATTERDDRTRVELSADR